MTDGPTEATPRGTARNLTRSTILAADLETAAGLWGKFKGLMGRRALAPGAGLWLPDSNGIHMMFMRFPIDAVFVAGPSADGSRPVLSIHRSLPTWRGLVPLVRGAKGVLELPAGTIDATATSVGDLVLIEDARSSRLLIVAAPRAHSPGECEPSHQGPAARRAALRHAHGDMPGTQSARSSAAPDVFRIRSVNVRDEPDAAERPIGSPQPRPIAGIRSGNSVAKVAAWFATMVRLTVEPRHDHEATDDAVRPSRDPGVRVRGRFAACVRTR